MDRRRIWIDTDPALGYVEDGSPRDVDDAFAIVEAIGSEHIELSGISTVFGNSPADVGFRVASELVRLTGSDTLVVQGAAGPGDGGAGFAVNDAATAMARALETGPMSVAAIGPLTNVAALIEHFPDRAQRIDEVVVVAGRSAGQVFELHGATGVPDFNFESDPHACQRLLESGIPVTLAGFELTSQVVLTRDHIESLRGRSEVADCIVEGALPWLEWWTGVFPDDGGFHPWDSAALAALTSPALFRREERGWRIQPRPEAAPGAPDTPWLELATEFPGSRAVYCPGFAADGAVRFLSGILSGVP